MNSNTRLVISLALNNRLDFINEQLRNSKEEYNKLMDAGEPMDSILVTYCANTIESWERTRFETLEATIEFEKYKHGFELTKG